MAYINSYTVYIDGINRTNNAVLPLKWGEFRDERLDEAYLSLRRVKRKSFSPLTPVEIVLSSKHYWHANENSTAKETMQDEVKRTKYYIVAGDNAKENPFGSGFYDHELYIIEVTKYLECITCDTQTITNNLMKYNSAGGEPVVPVES